MMEPARPTAPEPAEELLARWRAGEPRPVESFLRDRPDLAGQPDEVAVLVAAEVEARRERGESPALAEYLARFPACAAAVRWTFAVAPPDGPLAGHREHPMSTRNESSDRTVSGEPRRSIPGYEILAELGRGAMGVVYKARQSGLNRVVALKVILADGHADRESRDRFVREAAAVAALDHPGVVKVHDTGTAGGLPYMTLEYCPGGTLADQLAGTPLPARTAAALVEQLSRAVAAAHDRGILHRDLKPANVLVAADGAMKVADFGLAKVVGVDDGATGTGAAMGTPPYMAPEQVRDAKAVGPPADVYGLGAVLYECLTGRPPFKGATAADTLHQVLTQDPVAVRSLNAQVPMDLETVTLKSLAKDVGRRYPTAADLGADLRAFLEGRAITARPVGSTERAWKWVRRNPVLAGLVAAVVMTALGLVGSLYTQYRAALVQADAERKLKEAAVAREASAEQAKKNAEVAAAETVERQKAEVLKTAAEAKAATEAAQAVLVVGLLNDLFRSSDPLAVLFGEPAPLLGNVGVSEEQRRLLAPFLDLALKRVRAALPDGDKSVALTRAKLLAAVGNNMKTLGMLKDARPVLQEALDLRVRCLPTNDPLVWESELDVGRLEADAGNLTDAIGQFRRVAKLQRAANASEAALLTTQLYEGVALSVAGLPAAEEVLRAVVTARERLFTANHKDTLFAKLALVACLLDRHRTADILLLLPGIEAGIRAQPDQRVRDVFDLTLKFQRQLASAQGAMQLGPPLEAFGVRSAADGIGETVGRLAGLLPQDHIVLSVMRFERAKLLLRVNQAEEADRVFAQVLADVERTAGLAHPKALVLLAEYTDRLVATGRHDAAQATLKAFEAANLKQFDPDNPWRTVLLVQRARFECRRGVHGPALASAREALGLIRRGRFLPTTHNVNDVFVTAVRFWDSGARPLREVSCDLFAVLRTHIATAYGSESLERFAVLTRAGRQHYALNDRETAAACFDQARDILHAVPNLDRVVAGAALTGSGRLELDRGRFAAAEGYFRSALDRGPRAAGAERAEAAGLLADALVAQGRYKEAVPLLEEVRGRAGAPKPGERDSAGAEMRLAEAQYAAGAGDEYRKTVGTMLGRYGKSGDRETLARVAWAAYLDPGTRGWDANAFEARFAASLQPHVPFPWGYRGLALVRLRAGKFDGVEVALAGAGPAAEPVDHLLRGLVAVARGDRAAGTHLARAESLAARRQPGPSDPFVHAGRQWNEHTETALLLAELRAALAPPVAPPPRDARR